MKVLLGGMSARGCFLLAPEFQSVVLPNSTHQTPAAVGAFYCFNGLTDPINQHSIPGTIERSN